MQNLLARIDELSRKLFADTRRMRIAVLVLAGAAVLALVGFGIYYYNDRYVTTVPDPKMQLRATAEADVRKDPQNVNKRLALADLYLGLGDVSKAVGQAEEARKLDAANPGVDLMLGLAYARSARCTDSVTLLPKFIDTRKDAEMAGLDVQLQTAYYWLGDCYIQLKQPDKAIAPLETTIGYNSTDSDSMVKLGQAYLGAHRKDDAIKILQRAIAFVPNYREAYQVLGDVYRAKGDATSAEYADAMVQYCDKDYEAAYPRLVVVNNTVPTFGAGFTGTGLVCEAQRNYACAISSFETALKLSPEDLTAAQGLQRAKTLSGK